MQEEPRRMARTPLKRIIQLSVLVWVAMIAIDFLLHAGIFAATYLQDSPFLLSGVDAFRRIPLGYLALLVTAGLLVWIIDQTSARGWRKGLAIGLFLGILMGLSSTLGLFSISTASIQLLIVWFIAQAMETATAGMIIGQGLQMHSLRPLTLSVIIGFILLFLGVIIMQSVGLVPVMIAY